MKWIYQKGFTLMEMMIVVMIIGILAAFAWPQYERSVDRAARSDAQVALIGLAGALERRFTENNSYCDNAAGATVANCGDDAVMDTGAPTIYAVNVPESSATPNYTLTITSADRSSFTVAATRANRMVGDECGDLTYTNTGLRGVSADATASASDCW